MQKRLIGFKNPVCPISGVFCYNDRQGSLFCWRNPPPWYASPPFILNQSLKDKVCKALALALVVTFGFQWFSLHATDWVIASVGGSPSQPLVQKVIDHKFCSVCEYYNQKKDEGNPSQSTGSVQSFEIVTLTQEDRFLLTAPDYWGVSLKDILGDMPRSIWSPPSPPPQA